MTKKTGLFEMDNIDAQITFAKQTTITKTTQKISIEKELIAVNRQLEMLGLRPRTIKEYNHTFSRLVTFYNLTYLDEITVDKIYGWLDGLYVLIHYELI